jgi:hypothetical protein
MDTEEEVSKEDQDSLKILQFNLEINQKETYEMELLSTNRMTFDM